MERISLRTRQSPLATARYRTPTVGVDTEQRLASSLVVSIFNPSGLRIFIWNHTLANRLPISASSYSVDYCLKLAFVCPLHRAVALFMAGPSALSAFVLDPWAWISPCAYVRLPF